MHAQHAGRAQGEQASQARGQAAVWSLPQGAFRARSAVNLHSPTQERYGDSQGIGLSVEEALAFWRKSFSTITDDKFNKEYRYNIRHNYGLEGSRKNYTPKSCVSLLF